MRYIRNNLHRPKKIYTGAARGARDKYEVCLYLAKFNWGGCEKRLKRFRILNALLFALHSHFIKHYAQFVMILLPYFPTDIMLQIIWHILAHICLFLTFFLLSIKFSSVLDIGPQSSLVLGFNLCPLPFKNCFAFSPILCF